MEIETAQQKLHLMCRQKIKPLQDKIVQIIQEIQKREEKLILDAITLHEELADYAQKHQKNWTKKSLKTVHGTIGFRKRTCIELSENTAEALCNLGYQDYVQVTRMPDKRKMLYLNEHILEKVGAKKVVEEHFYVTTTSANGEL